MSNEDQNVTALRQAYRRWADSKGKDQSGWLAIVGDDLTLRSLADGAPGMEFSSQRRGKLELLDYLNGLTADWDMIFYEIADYVAQGDRVVAIGRTAWRNRRTGKVADTAKVDLWRFENGRAVEFFELYDTARVLAAAGASPA